MTDDIQRQQKLFNINPYDLEKLGIGGLSDEFITLFRRAFITRLLPPSMLNKLKTKHVKGVLLYGPPGTGKTLIARKIGEMLNCKPPKIINGPEILNKYVGQSEENIRKLFSDAEKEQREKGDKSGLHLIIFDEFDSLCKKRGMSSDNTGVGDNIVNQLLSKIDGVDSLNNVLLIGMTNRKDLIDDAILRPGRFEVHIQINLPNENGRLEIFKIHTKNLNDSKILHSDVNLVELSEKTKNFSGAEIEGLVKSAQTYALQRHVDKENPSKLVDVQNMTIRQKDFTDALYDISPAFGKDTDDVFSNLSNEIIPYGNEWNMIDQLIKIYVKDFCDNKIISTFRLLLHGKAGSGKTTLSNYIAGLINYPFVKIIHPSLYVGYTENQKVSLIKKIFSDAYQSNESVIIIDDLERLIDFSDYGGRYSNTVLQALIVLIGQNTKKNNKLFIIATCKNRHIIEKIELYDTFDKNIIIGNIDNNSAKYIYEYYNKKPDNFNLINEDGDGIPIKKFINNLLIG